MTTKNYSKKLSGKYGESPPIEIPLDCIKRKKTYPEPVVKDGIMEKEFIVGSYNPKKNSDSLIKNMKEPGDSSLLGDQIESVTDSDDGLFFGDLEL